MEYTTPMYSVAVVAPNGTKYVIKKMSDDKSTASNIVTSLTLSEPESQIAQKATIKVFNQYISGHGYPSNIFPVKSRVFVYAKGAGKDTTTEVFRGYLWEGELNINLTNGTTYTMTCYDNLIYLMNSEISEYFSKGKSTKTIVTTLCKKWGISVSYDYESRTHPKLPLKGTLADVLTTDVLDTVIVSQGSKYVLRSIKDTLHVIAQGTNTPIYRISRGDNGIMLSWGRNVTMEGMITKVVITGKTNDNGKTKVAATVTKNTGTYGTLQKIISKDEDTKLADAKKEANTILKRNAKPTKEYDVTALDIPWVRKGDRVSAEFNKGQFVAAIVKEITHNCDDGTMDMVLRRLNK